MNQKFLDHEVTSETNHFEHTINFIKPTESPRRLPSPAQLGVQFICHTLHRYFNILSFNNTEAATLLNHIEEPLEEIPCQFDLRAMLNLKVIVIDIGNVSQRLGREVIHKEESRGLITLQVSISKEHNMFRCENCLTQRVERESIIEAEDSERVMVPASESSIKKLLKKRVRVEEGESCSVCLEEFKDGTYETSMDCSHVFHRECTGKWLRQSHYCPVSRYEMPTDDEGGGFHQDDELVDRFGLGYRV